MRILAADPCPNKVLLVIDTYPGTAEPFSKRSGSPRIRQIFNRTTSISLDSAHSRRNDLVNRLAASGGPNGPAKVVHFDFETLLNNPETGDRDYAAARGVRTTLNITPEVQTRLLEFGNSAVVNEQPALEKIVSDVFAK